MRSLGKWAMIFDLRYHEILEKSYYMIHILYGLQILSLICSCFCEISIYSIFSTTNFEKQEWNPLKNISFLEKIFESKKFLSSFFVFFLLFLFWPLVLFYRKFSELDFFNIFLILSYKIYFLNNINNKNKTI